MNSIAEKCEQENTSASVTESLIKKIKDLIMEKDFKGWMDEIRTRKITLELVRKYITYVILRRKLRAKRSSDVSQSF